MMMASLMGTDIEMLRTRFLKAYASVPAGLREDIIAVVEEKTYSWDTAFVEVNAKSQLGDKIIRTLEEIGMFKE